MNNNIYTYAINPFQQGDDLLQQISSDHVDPVLSECLDAATARPGSKSLTEPPAAFQNKKMVHREAEKQRRREMNSLYAALRSQLPLEYVKGKKSISDHMNEATNYIQHLVTRNQQLRHKRDKLKNPSNSSTGTSDTVLEGPWVTVERCWPGVEVVVASGLKADSVMSLSRVLQVLCEGGLSAVSCVSSTVNGKLIHTIQAEVEAESAFDDISSLRHKLINIVHSTN